jgi:hypothetical protein
MTALASIQDDSVFHVEFLNAQGHVIATARHAFADALNITPAKKGEPGTLGYWDIGTHREKLIEFATFSPPSSGRKVYLFHSKVGISLRFTYITKELFDRELYTLVGLERPVPLENDVKVQAYFKSMIQTG